MPISNSSRRLQSASERSRGRSSTSSSHVRQRRSPTELPEYEPLACPLNTDAIRALTQLSTKKDTRKFEEQVNKSIELLSASVRDLNDKYAERKASLKTLQEKRGDRSEKNDRERAEEKAVLALKNEVPQLTDQCDLAVRQDIDLKIELEDGNTALRQTAHEIEAKAADSARRHRARSEDGDDEMPDDELPAPLGLLRDFTNRLKTEYEGKSLYEKYGVNNDYIGFKSLWHDAVHGGDGKPLPDATKWFSQNGDDAADDDDDLIVAEEHLDIHCPLSMAVMQDPYTSTKCKHTFEKDSIVQFLRTQPGGRARCPQTGCNKEVSIHDFQPDPVMLRRIKRQLASQRAGIAEDDDDEDVDIDGDSDMKVTQSRTVKLERENRGRRRPSPENIEDEDEEDEDEEDEEDEESE